MTSYTGLTKPERDTFAVIQLIMTEQDVYSGIKLIIMTVHSPYPPPPPLRQTHSPHPPPSSSASDEKGLSGKPDENWHQNPSTLLPTPPPSQSTRYHRDTNVLYWTRAPPLIPSQATATGHQTDQCNDEPLRFPLSSGQPPRDEGAWRRWVID